MFCVTAEMLTTILPRSWLTRVGKENNKSWPTQTTLAKQPTSCECFPWGQGDEAKFYIPWGFRVYWASLGFGARKTTVFSSFSSFSSSFSSSKRDRLGCSSQKTFWSKSKATPPTLFSLFFKPWNFDLDQKCQKQLFSQKWRPEKR